MSHSSSGGFVAANPEWLYGILTRPEPVNFDPQPDNLWLAHTGGEKFLLLTPDLVVRMLNEALEHGMTVLAVHRETAKALVFHYVNGVLTEMPASVTHHA